MANPPILNFTSVDNSLAYQLYQDLLASGATLADMDVGEGLINYTGKECQNQASTCLVGAHDGKVTSNEVFEFALNNYEKYQKLIEGTLRSPLPWVLDDQDSTTTFDADVRAKVQAAIDVLTVTLLAQGLEKGSQEYEEKLALGIFYLAMAPQKEIIQSHSESFDRITTELAANEMEWFKGYLIENGGFRGRDDYTEEYTALGSIKSERNKCTEYSKKLFAFFKMAGFSPVFVFVPNSILKSGVVFSSNKSDLQELVNEEIKKLPQGMDHICIGLQLGGKFQLFDVALLSSNLVFQSFTPLTLRQYLSSDLSSQGISWLGKGEVDKAIGNYTQALQINSQNTNAYLNRGAAWSTVKGDVDKSIKDYTQALQIDPRFAGAYFNRGVVLFRKGEFDKAIKDYSQALQIDPQYADAYYNRGLAWINMGDKDNAIADFSEVLLIDPQNSDAYYFRGLVRATIGENDNAMLDFNETLRINPQNADALYYRGVGWTMRGQLDKAIADYTEAIKIDPRYLNAYYNRAIVLSEKGDFDNAVADYTEILRIDPQNAEAYCNRGVIWYRKENYNKVITDFGNAIKNNLQVDLKPAIIRMATSKWRQESQKARAAQFEVETSFDIAKVEAIFIYSYSLWLAGNQQESIQELKIVSEALSFKTPPSDATKVFFESQFQLMPKAMSQDTEVQKIVASIKAKIK